MQAAHCRGHGGVSGAGCECGVECAGGVGTGHAAVFMFEGFLSAKASARQVRLQALRASLSEPLTLVLYEAPHRIVETLGDVSLVFGAGAVAWRWRRELTKIHEEFLRGTVDEVAHTLLKERDRIRGEMVLLIEAQPASGDDAHLAIPLLDRIAELEKAEGLSEMDAPQKDRQGARGFEERALPRAAAGSPELGHPTSQNRDVGHPGISRPGDRACGAKSAKSRCPVQPLSERWPRGGFLADRSQIQH